MLPARRRTLKPPLTAGAGITGTRGIHPHDIACVADAARRGLERRDSGRGVVRADIQVVTRYRRNVEFSAAVHLRHAFLGRRHHVQARQPRKESPVRRPQPGVSFSRGAVEAAGSPQDSLQP